MRPPNYTLLTLLLPAFLALPSAIAASNAACYDWECTPINAPDHYLCEFDASCTELDGQLWRYRWDFGDGSFPVLTSNPVIGHEYFPCCESSQYQPFVELTVIPLSDDPFSEECQIWMAAVTGPPIGTDGSCPM